MQQRLLFRVIFTLACMSSLPTGAMIVTSSPEPPATEGLILGFDTENDVGSYLCTHGTGTAIDMGQTFRLSSPAVLDKVTFKLRALTEQTPGELVTLSFGTFTDPLDHSMNELLAAETRGLPSALPIGEAQYVTFDIANQSLEADRQYGFVLGFTGGGNVNNARMDVLNVGDDAYTDGIAVERDGAVITMAREHDLVFFLHGDQQATVGDALLLRNGRFRVEVAWETRLGEVGAGVPVMMTDATGYFWFFDPTNVELVVKVLDACFDPFDHFWVYAAGLTDVGVTMTVTDTLADEAMVYRNTLGNAFEPITDTAAFATCSP